MSKYFPKRLELSDVTLPNEIWKDIPNFNQEYKISNLGRVYSQISGKILSSKPNKTYGYVICPLGVKDKRVFFRVHRLVAEAFLSNPFNKKEVNHKNKDRANNTVENLEWMSGWENNQHKLGYNNWHNSQGRITPSDYSVVRRKLKGFSEIIKPILEKLVPVN